MSFFFIYKENYFKGRSTLFSTELISVDLENDHGRKSIAWKSGDLKSSPVLLLSKAISVVCFHEVLCLYFLM